VTIEHQHIFKCRPGLQEIAVRRLPGGMGNLGEATIYIKEISLTDDDEITQFFEALNDAVQVMKQINADLEVE